MFLHLTLNQFLIFVLVLTRISGVVMTAPVLGARTVPLKVRALLAVAISLVITPMFFGIQLPDSTTLVDIGIVLVRELILGLGVGLSVSILFAALHLTGQIVGQMSGMQLADVFDPTFDDNTSVFGQLMDMVALAVFVIIGGHRHLMAALLDTFAWMPPGTGKLPDEAMLALSEFVSQSFVIGLRAGAPAMLSLLMSILITGLISRTLPQLNVIAVGFSLNAIIMLATLAITLGSAAWLFQDEAIVTLDKVRSVLKEPSSTIQQR